MIGILISAVFLFKRFANYRVLFFFTILQYFALQTRQFGEDNPSDLAVISKIATVITFIYFTFRPTEKSAKDLFGLFMLSYFLKFFVNVALLFDSGYRFNETDIYILDAIFMGAIIASVWSSQFISGIKADQNKKMMLEIQKKQEENANLIELKKKQQAAIRLAQEKLEDEVFSNSIRINPWSVLDSLLKEIRQEHTHIATVIDQGIAEISRLKKTNTVSMAIVGEFSSGKSTFINTIVGKEILRYSNDECTAVPTRVRHNSIIKFSEYSNDGWFEISESTYLKRQTEYCEKISFLEAQLESQILKELDIEIIDTPGASSKDSRYEKRTLAAIEEADACVILMDSAQDGSKSFLDFLAKVVTRQKRIYLMLSRSDMRSEEEIREHLDFTLPKLSSKLNIPKDEMFLVGLKAGIHVITPSQVFKIIGDQIRTKRGEILRERVLRLGFRLRTVLNPAMAEIESAEAQRYASAKSKPSSFDELWSGWLSKVDGVPWVSIANEMEAFCEGSYKLVFQEMAVDLKPKIDSIWFNESERNRLSKEYADAAENKFEKLVRFEFLSKVESHFRQIDLAGEDSVFSYLEENYGVVQSSKSLIEIVKAENINLKVNSSNVESNIRTYMGLAVRTQVNQALSFVAKDFKYDPRAMNRGSGVAGGMLTGGHPLIGLAIIASSVMFGKSEADENFWNQISNWFKDSCVTRKAALLNLATGFPTFMKRTSIELTRLLEESKLPLLSNFDETNIERVRSQKRLLVINRTIQTLEYVTNESDVQDKKIAG